MESDGSVRDAAAASLAALQDSREQLARRARQPWWYDPAAGVLVFVLFAAMATHGIGWILGAVVLFAIGMRLLMVAYRRATGFRVNGLRPGRTRRATTVWFAVYALVVVPAAVLDLGYGRRWADVVAGAVLGLTVALISRWWTTIYIAELRERP